MTKIDEHRAKLEALAHTHPWIREVIKELDRMKKITPLACVNCEMGYWHQIDILEDKVDELTAERDALQREVDNMLVELDSCEAVDEVNSELAAERDKLAADLKECDESRIELKAQCDRLESQVRQLQGDLKSARKSSDSWYEVSVRQSGKLVKLRRQLKAERDMWRGIVGSMLDAADEIRRIADSAMPRGAAALVDPDGEVVG